MTTGKRRAIRGEQLRFDLDGATEEKRVVLVPMSMMHGRRFAEIVSEMKPKIVLDMRHAIRFDLPGTNRSHIFAQFTSVAAFYTTASLPWHEFTPADFMLDRGKLSQRLHHEIFEREEDRIMILLPDTLQATWLRTYLNRRLSEWAKSDWRIEEASLTSYR
ncbi:hypothetical protein [Sinorhizobium meliloti]|uniref:hypothetical protein n=1 Tax=Rhizobium meliloti TaxID=382 RepID=UPI000FD97F57|nr:hypothetical protein [Sinorhizobium meliloti]MCO6426039.1 hypothetical protein [Sinorhizobium meliloti]RVL38764.1 hypothetical protein CN148_09655 [Sinorhizobium meliloti]